MVPTTFLENQICQIKEKISYVEEEMEKIITENITLSTNYQLLTSIKGIGPVNAIVLLCVTDNSAANSLSLLYSTKA